MCSIARKVSSSDQEHLLMLPQTLAIVHKLFHVSICMKQTVDIAATVTGKQEAMIPVLCSRTQVSKNIPLEVTSNYQALNEVMFTCHNKYSEHFKMRSIPLNDHYCSL